MVELTELEKVLATRVSRPFRESLREWLQPIEAKLNLIMN